MTPRDAWNGCIMNEWKHPVAAGCCLPESPARNQGDVRKMEEASHVDILRRPAARFGLAKQTPLTQSAVGVCRNFPSHRTTQRWQAAFVSASRRARILSRALGPRKGPAPAARPPSDETNPAHFFLGYFRFAIRAQGVSFAGRGARLWQLTPSAFPLLCWPCSSTGAIDVAQGIYSISRLFNSPSVLTRPAAAPAAHRVVRSCRRLGPRRGKEAAPQTRQPNPAPVLPHGASFWMLLMLALGNVLGFSARGCDQGCAVDGC